MVSTRRPRSGRSTPTAKPVVVIGDQPELEKQTPSEIRALLTKASHSPQLTVWVCSMPRNPASGMRTPHSTVRHATCAYAESNLPKNRKSRVIQGNAAFSGLGYALYLGSGEGSGSLLASNISKLPIRGRRAAITVPFGDNQLRIVMTPAAELGGTLLAKLQWLLLVFGLLLTAGAASLTERLVRRREQAVALADELGEIAEENARLYAAQRTVAQTLQHSLLPETLPDVSGSVGRRRGTSRGSSTWRSAATGTTSCVATTAPCCSSWVTCRAGAWPREPSWPRCAMRSGRTPRRAMTRPTILTKLAQLISISEDGHFATVLCGVIDVERHEVTLANAAHPEPLLIAGETQFVHTNIGVPIGVEGPSPYASVTITVPAAATLLAYTDGLVERRGEVIDTGLQRLRDTAGAAHDSVEALLEDLTRYLPPDGPADDIAILGVKWTN